MTDNIQITWWNHSLPAISASDLIVDVCGLESLDVDDEAVRIESNYIDADDEAVRKVILYKHIA